MSALVHASERTVNDWERDVSSPKASVLAALAQHGFDVRYVVTGSRDYAPPVVVTPEEQLLLAHWRQASKQVRRAALGALIGAPVEAALKHVQQTILGSVGHVTTGDMHIQDGRMTVQAPAAPYVPPAKPRKRSGK